LGAPPLGFGGFANPKRFGRRSVLALGVPNTGAGRAVRSNAAAARSCPASVAGVASCWSPRRHGRPTARRHRFKHKVLEKLKLFLSRTKPAIRRHSRSYGKDGQCRYRQKEQNLV